jgi:uncharacterized membrane protein YtjA (UPF0391 family)
LRNEVSAPSALFPHRTFINNNYLNILEEKMNKKGVTGWLAWAIIFLIIALVAAVFGFGLISGVSLTIAKWLAAIFVVLFIISVIAHTIKSA